MTVLGKILVFVNLVFALITMGLITMVFIARTNWRVGYESLEKQLQVARADLATERDSKQVALEQRAKDLKLAEEDLKKARAETEVVRGDLAATQTRLTAAERERDSAKAINETTKDENKRLIAEQQNLQGQLQKRDATIVGLNRDLLKYRDDATKYELAWRATTQRAELLLEQLTAARTQLRAMEATAGRPGGGRSVLPNAQTLPPAEDVRGQIVEMDSARGLATVSVGSDVGVMPGTTLEIFRLDADPSKSLYLGTLQIISANSKSAVGRYTLVSSRYPLKKGDEVASRLSISR